MTLGAPDRVSLVLFSLALLLLPFYFGDSGDVQISHVVVVLTTAFYFTVAKRLVFTVSAERKMFATVIVILVGYVNAINAYHAWQVHDTSPLKFGSYYVFNVMVALLALDMGQRQGVRMFRVIYGVLLASLVLQFVLTGLRLGRIDAGRSIGFFNNPNQTGYYAVLTGTTVLLTARLGGIRSWWTPASLCLALGISMNSMSRASMAAVGLLIIFYLIRSRQPVVHRAALAVALACGGLMTVAYWSVVSSESVFFHTFGKRFVREDIDVTRMKGRVDSLEGRGYLRLIEHPEFLLFGGGEGTGRFGKEFHSTLGAIQLGYGIVGSALFFLLLYSALRGCPTDCALLLIPPLVYGLAHNGIRQPLLWIFLVLLSFGRSVRGPPER